MNSAPCPRSLLGLILALLAGPTHAAEPVEASLIIPEAATHVIGDPIPLLWRFQNVSTQALAFMWEGCCRLNGRLTVTAVDKPITMVPPGQALAHMFAKAERLEPGVARDFDTFLSDWTQLTASGTYELSGRYTGVLPEQQPQVPRGLALWRDAAVTPPIRVTLTSVEDYLAQRANHSSRRGLELTLTGPADLPPLDPIFFRLTIRNSGPHPQSFPWPEAATWWILDHENRRVRGAATAIEGPYEEISLAPGSTFTRNLPIKSDLLEGEPFGDYRLFVDLRPEGPDLPRVPSVPLSLRWQLAPNQVIDLLRQAAAGPTVGLRNAPLKLLRLYLTPLRPTLDTLDPSQLTPAALALHRQLRLAACLKEFAPTPGRVDLPLLSPPNGASTLASPQLVQCLPATHRPIAQMVREVLSVRRHLGWEVGLTLQPEPATPLAQLSDLALSLAPLQPDLAGPPRALLVASNITNAIQFPPTLTPANVVIKLALDGPRVLRSAARKSPDPRQPQLPAQFAPPEIPSLTLPSVEDDDAFAQLLDDGSPRTPRVLILADRSITWSQLCAALTPLGSRPLLLDLVVL